MVQLLLLQRKLERMSEDQVENSLLRNVVSLDASLLDGEEEAKVLDAKADMWATHYFVQGPYEHDVSFGDDVLKKGYVRIEFRRI